MSEILEALKLTPEDLHGTYNMDTPTWYEWRILPGGYPRTWCRTHEKLMTWALKIDKNYPQQMDRHSKGAHQVVYTGRVVQVWECRPCGQWVVKWS